LRISPSSSRPRQEPIPAGSPSRIVYPGELPPETVGEIRRVMERITLKGDKPG